MSWATATVSGYLGAKPNIKHFDTGSVLCTFVIYVNRRKNNEEESPEPLRFYVDVWGNQAETCMNLLDKGTKATVTGNLDEESFQAKDGTLVTRTVIQFAQVLDYGLKPSSERHSVEEKSEDTAEK